MMIEGFIFHSTFALLGTLYLIVLTFQDYRDMTVDSKYNYTLLGVAISMIQHAGVSFWYVLSVALGLSFVNLYGRKINFFGKGDFSAFNWLFLGLAIISPFILSFFIVCLVVLGSIYYFVRKKLSLYDVRFFNGRLSFLRRSYPINKPVPFYPVILGSWLLTLPLLFL